MTSSILRRFFPRHTLFNVSGILIAALLAGCLILTVLPPFSSHAFAAAIQRAAAGRTCVQAPTMDHCNKQDPELAGCAADATTIAQENIVENGMTIGRVERRFSQRCQSWWGRVFDTRVGSNANMLITVAGTTFSALPTFVGNQYRILYSPMVFEATPTQQVPEITGTLLIDGIVKPPSATIPAITIPTKK